MHYCIGVHVIPLDYVMRAKEEVLWQYASAINVNKPHAHEFESIEEELIARARHRDHPSFRRQLQGLF